MTFLEEIEILSSDSLMLLRRLEPEPDYVKKFIETECKRIEEEGWIEQNSDKPWVRTFERDKYTLKVAFVHARKGEDITGADLAFELKDKKIIVIQSKKSEPMEGCTLTGSNYRNSLNLRDKFVVNSHSIPT